MIATIESQAKWTDAVNQEVSRAEEYEGERDDALQNAIPYETGDAANDVGDEMALATCFRVQSCTERC
eukprot:CAMPEP_0197832670 /NCGR_PEP_ID=MMETSP1437-20131217/15507_1 /TAXON_ID=49252 ORGANISM="Eucampia antarctica, Strain CCMP1452" /NCGR_SAMPLE_ID=MMETSP1437 /ASSEMBLY_ACC=CAM_ASM_001096 /LENGTH=67 /DNA_ID=CAMNT_0043436155 /DNA_START=59 /DNA_END=262 /DNA_ORIENTATION=+